MERIRRYIKGWWGAVLPPVVLVASDLGFPDAPWWVSWALAAVSLLSYIAGRFNAGDDDRVTRLEADLASLEDERATLEAERDRLEGELASLRDPLEKAEARIALLPEGTVALLWKLYWKGRLTTAELREMSDDAGLLLGGCEEMGLVGSEAKVYVGVVWWLTEPCRCVLDGMAGMEGQAPPADVVA